MLPLNLLWYTAVPVFFSETVQASQTKHSPQRTADSAVDCINTEIGIFLSLCINATICLIQQRQMQLVWLSLKHSLSRCNYDLYTIDTWDSSSAAEPKMTQNLFFKWAILGLFFAFVWTLQFLQQYNVKKCPSSIWTHDLWNASLLPKPLIRTSFCKTFLFVRVGIFSLENSGILLASYRSKRRKVSDKLKENNLPFSH